MIRTRLGIFASEFQSALRTLFERLHLTAWRLEEQGDRELARAIQPRVEDAVHQLEILVRTVSRRRSSALVLGPAKSGKSTLLDALAASYVVDVSGLPSYPCAVHVGHASSWTGKAVLVDGSTVTFPDPDGMKDFVARSQAELYEKVRELESEGQSFGPERHLPSAIRRIELGLPADALEDSGTLLVEFPALNDRIPFDYEELTRGLADSRAAAIFMVRTDDPFPRRALEEFELLMARFERLFLVLNVDTTRRDLAEHGELVAGDEARDPAAAIDAFRRQSFSDGLERAISAGRVRVYPIDVQAVAARRLRGLYTGAAPETLEQDVNEPTQAGFGVLLHEVTAHLDRDDRALLFLSDSLRQADVICEGLVQLCDESAIARLPERLESARANRFEAQEKLESIERIEGIAGKEEEWSQDFQALLGSLESGASARARELGKRASRAIDTVVDGWFRSHAGFHDLVSGEIRPVLAKCDQRIAEYVYELLQKELERAEVLRGLPRERLLDLERARVRLFAVTREAGTSLPSPSVASAEEQPELDIELPLKKDFGDRLLFRSTSTVRRRFVGTDEGTQRISPSEKNRRLSRTARRDIKNSIGEAFTEALEASARAHCNRLYDAFIEAFCERLRRNLNEISGHGVTPLVASESEIEKIEALDVEFARLREEAQHTRSLLAELRAQNTWIEDELDTHALAELAPEEDEDLEEDGDEIEEERYRQGGLLQPEAPQQRGTAKDAARARALRSEDLPPGVVWHGSHTWRQGDPRPQAWEESSPAEPSDPEAQP